MKTSTSLKTNWNNQELKAYFYIYAMNADLEESKKDIKLIKKHISEDIYAKMYKEFERDNDYQVIEKIINTIEDLKYTEDQVRYLLDKMKNIFETDKKFSIMERNLASGLERIFYLT